MSETNLDVEPAPRERVGPFVILGIDKDADEAAVEAHWAERIVACRKGKSLLKLEDVHWARDELRSREGRTAADAESLNPDLASGEVRRLARLYHVDGSPPAWEPLDPEPPVEFVPAALPEPQELAAESPGPDVPLELPAVAAWLARFAAAVPAPWAFDHTG